MVKEVTLSENENQASYEEKKVTDEASNPPDEEGWTMDLQPPKGATGAPLQQEKLFKKDE